jgi:hypothetical protein
MMLTTAAAATMKESNQKMGRMMKYLVAFLTFRSKVKINNICKLIVAAASFFFMGVIVSYLSSIYQLRTMNL